MLSKLQIQAFSDNELRSQTGSYSLQINPNSLSHSHSASFAPAKDNDAAGTVLKFHTQNAEEMSFDFVIDATGVVPGVTDVAKEIESFRTLAYTYQGAQHSPNYLKIVWGGLTFNCMLTSLKIAYQLFAPSGAPLRAQLSVAFRQHLTPEDLARLGDKKSADLTHAQVVTAGSTLPLMAYGVYDRPDLYPQVARANDMNDLVHLTAGRALNFPPYEESRHD
ncbi:hypothetical protein PVW48_06000 [Dinoroseobacter sp. PD6]|uniref:CIS tube protein n=1 Tax=Dinoroseobacter sp. PD6 TaxID=3028384 RepID=UPI00237B0C00|nr:hypothetical protein [Dinoroseobacter sp. PD6]MDD9716287.1 hypothetical protein [Dinoroseobacter sp. PD6]